MEGEPVSTDTSADALLTIPDAARLVRRPVGTVADWRRKGLLPVAAWDGPRPLVKRSDVMECASRMQQRKGNAKLRRQVKRGALSAPVGPATVPTTTRPGSEERLRVYEERVERKETCFHPADTKLDRRAV